MRNITLTNIFQVAAEEIAKLEEAKALKDVQPTSDKQNLNKPKLTQRSAETVHNGNGNLVSENEDDCDDNVEEGKRRKKMTKVVANKNTTDDNNKKKPGAKAPAKRNHIAALAGTQRGNGGAGAHKNKKLAGTGAGGSRSAKHRKKIVLEGNLMTKIGQLAKAGLKHSI